MIILGISCYYHDSSATLLKDGVVIAAAEEERFTRTKHDKSFPINAITWCLKEAGITINQVNHIGFYEKPLLKFERVLYQHFAGFPRSYKTFVSALPSWLNEKLRILKKIKKTLKYKGDVFFTDHHMSHAASAFLVSPYDEATIVTADGVGEWTTLSYGKGIGTTIELHKEIRFPDSIGLLYSTITAYIGFSVNNSEYKVMGMAPYGTMNKTNPYFKKLLQVMDLKDDGSFRFDLSYFVYHYKDKMPSRKLCTLLGGPIRHPDEPITQRHKDIAAAVQLVTEEIMVRVLNHAYKETQCATLVMAGGVALNSVFNGKILSRTPFTKLWIQPNATDGGTSLGVASYVYHTILGNKRTYVQRTAYLGPGYSNQEIKTYLDTNTITYTTIKDDAELVTTTAKLIYENNVVGWFQNKMEWGPRALGARSILSNACNPKMQEILNSKVKHRECYDKKTQILTKNGWKFFKDLKAREEVATLNPKSNKLEYQRITKRVEYSFSGNMVSFKNKRIDLLVTPNHKIWARRVMNHNKGSHQSKPFKLEEAETFLRKEHVQIKAISNFVGKEQKFFTLPEIKKSKYDPRPQIGKIPMDLWLEFLGYYLSEGSYTYDRSHYYVSVAQSKQSRRFSRIQKCLRNLGFVWAYNSRSLRTSNKQLYEYLKQFGKAKNKFIPQELLQLSRRQLSILFQALMRSDRTYRPHQFKYTTTSKQLADNVQELGIKLGYSVITSFEKKRSSNHNDTYYVRLNSGSSISFVRREQTTLKNYKGKVYCVTVPKHHILCVKRNEKVVFSGNSFRPFAPVVCEDDALKYFDCDTPLPEPTDYMLMVYPIKKNYHKKIPAVTHVDGSGRLQSIRKEQHPLYYDTVKAFGTLSGIPILINTSFNIRGEPIVCTPHDAYRCMMGTGIDYLIIGNFLVKRSDNPKDIWDSEKLAVD